jgi:1-acyl-sn-glycerol-3-phosphate acyltransferase
MYHKFFSMPLVGFLFRDAKVIPIAPAHEDAGKLDAAFDQIAAELEAGEIVCIFPEGKLTRDGKMNPFRTGVERILARTPVPVVPMALGGLWESLFSHHRGRNPWRLFKHLRRKVSLRIGARVAPVDANAAMLASVVAELGRLEVRLPADG